MTPTTDELIMALEAAAGDILEMGCTCVDRSQGHQPGYQGVVSAKPYYDLAERARAIDVPARTSRQTQDCKEDVKKCTRSRTHILPRN